MARTARVRSLCMGPPLLQCIPPTARFIPPPKLESAARSTIHFFVCGGGGGASVKSVRSAMLALMLGTFAGLAGGADTGSGPAFAAMRWRMVGPFRGGRTVTAAGVPGEPDHFYFGSVGGGVWESRNAGR